MDEQDFLLHILNQLIEKEIFNKDIYLQLTQRIEFLKNRVIITDIKIYQQMPEIKK